MARSLRFFISAITILLVTTALFAAPAFAQQDSAQASISSAQSTIVNCYSAVKNAEAAGANVTSLTATLNTAAGLLSQAELAYASNDYSTAYNDAAQSQAALNGFTSQATALQQNAANSSGRSGLTVIFSLIASVAIFSVGLGTYFSLSRKGKKRLNGYPTV